MGIHTPAHRYTGKRGVEEKPSTCTPQSPSQRTRCRWHAGCHGKPSPPIPPPALAAPSSPSSAQRCQHSSHATTSLGFPCPSKTLLLTPQRHYQHSHTNTPLAWSVDTPWHPGRGSPRSCVRSELMGRALVTVYSGTFFFFFFILIQVSFKFFFDVGLFWTRSRPSGWETQWAHATKSISSCAASLESPRSPLLSSSIALWDYSFPTQSFTFPFLFYYTQIWCNLYLTMHYHFQGQIFFCNPNYVIILFLLHIL